MTDTPEDVVDSVQIKAETAKSSDHQEAIFNETNSLVKNEVDDLCSISKEEVKEEVKTEICNPIHQNVEVKIDVIDRNNCGICRRSAQGESEKLSPHGQVFKYEDDPFWISCDGCLQWFHGSCVGVEELEDFFIEIYHCDNCALTLGPTTLKVCVAPQRLNCFEPKEKELPMEIGSKSWIEKFASEEHNITPADNRDCIVCENGADFSSVFDNLKTWEKVFLIKNKEELRLRMPSEDFDVDSLVEIFGNEYVVDTIDVYRQATVSMRLDTFASKFKGEKRDRLYNFLSLEFSKSQKMREYVAPPIAVNKISFVHRLWPDCHDPVNWVPSLAKAIQMAEEHKLTKPDVALFCLCGMAGSFTDFHIDFGGSSVWYHIFKGKKIFYIAAPTDSNLRVYEEYQKMEDRTLTFLGDLFPPGELRRVVIEQGQTLMIPAGWIHAVFTPVDSLVFGGNFLHVLNLSMQLKVYDLEHRVKTDVGLDEKFMFPHFELVHWYAVKNLLTDLLREANEDETILNPRFFEGFEILNMRLKEWATRDKKEGKPTGTFNDIMKKFNKQISAQKKLVLNEEERNSTSPVDGGSKYLKIKIKMGKKDQTVTSSLVDSNEQQGKPPQGSLKVTISRSSIEDGDPEITETSGVIDNIDMSQMFTSRSSRGRVRKPSKWLATSVGELLDDSSDIPNEKVVDVDWGNEMEAIVQKEEQELLAEEKNKSRSKGKKHIINLTAEAPAPKKKKAPTTAKQRLANRMNLK